MEMVTWDRLSSSDHEVVEQSGIKPRGITHIHTIYVTVCLIYVHNELKLNFILHKNN